MIAKFLILTLLVVFTQAKTYPIYKQCDQAWKDQQLGTGPDTLCSAGCLVSSVAMALKGYNLDFNPSILNQWLKTHSGYIHEDLLIWAAVNPLGLIFQGKVSNSLIKTRIDQGYVVILNVQNGDHYVLAYAYNGDTFYVNDPGSSNTGIYSIYDCKQGQTGVYSMRNSGYHKLLRKIKDIVGFSIGQVSTMEEKPQNLISQA